MPPRYNYPTVADFVNAVKATKQPYQLTLMWTKLFRGANAWSGIHPWHSSQQEYHDCWKALFDHARKLGFTYNNHRKEFEQRPASNSHESAA